MRQRDQNFQNISWFWDLYNRGLLNLDPPYQRRSVWTPRYREEFVDTVLLDYPAPAIFLYEEILPEGAEENFELGTGSEATAKYAVVDGKQRLMAVFDFMAGEFAVGETSALQSFRGMYYKSLSTDVRKDFLRYKFSVEYLPSENETEINNIFDRLNRNVKKLTSQELRHARFDGAFISATEELTEWMLEQLPKQFPRIYDSSRRQMKDVEIVATLLLYLELGPKGLSTSELDKAFAEREEAWEKSDCAEEFRAVIKSLSAAVSLPVGDSIVSSRLRNQADFYSLFAAMADLRRENALPAENEIAVRLEAFARQTDSAEAHTVMPRIAEYLEAARSASNDAGPRRTRISVVKEVLLGTLGK